MLYNYGLSFHFLSSSSAFNGFPLHARSAYSRMMILLSSMWLECPVHGTMEQMELRRVISPNLSGSCKVNFCNHSLSFKGVDSPFSAQDNSAFKSGTMPRNAIPLNLGNQEAINLCLTPWPSLFSTVLVNGAPRTLKLSSTTCFKFKIMMPPLYLMKVSRLVKYSLPSSGSESRIFGSTTLVLSSPEWRSLASLSLLVLGAMANSESSASSVPDPLMELEAEVKVLR